MDEDRRKEIADYEYEVWRHGGNPDCVEEDDVQEGFDWVYDEVKNITNKCTGRQTAPPVMLNISKRG